MGEDSTALAVAAAKAVVEAASPTLPVGSAIKMHRELDWTLTTRAAAACKDRNGSSRCPSRFIFILVCLFFSYEININ